MHREPIIQVRSLVAGYDGDVILEEVSFDIQAGEVFVILGGSGCGKTTLLRNLIGLNPPLSGDIIIDGDNIGSGTAATIERMMKKVGVLFQSSALFGSMTIAENVALPIEEYTALSANAVYDLVRMKLCMVDLSGYEDYLPSEISGGMKKRAGLARAMAMNPKILFLDEPTAGLDPPTSAGIDDLILNVNESLGTTIVIVTHELDSIMKIAQRVIMLDKSSKGIIAEGDPRELRDHSSHPVVRQFFNRQARVSDNQEVSS